MRLQGLGVTIIVATIAAAGCSSRTGPIVHDHQVVERGVATSASVQIDMGAGELEVKPGATALMEADFDYNVPSLKPAIDYQVKESAGSLGVSQSGSASGSYENHWRISLQESTPLGLHLNLGAGDATFVLGRLNVTGLDVRMGAGDLVVDLRGTPAASYRVDIKAGVGDTTVYLPASAALSVATSGAIGDVNVTGLEKRDGRWINPKAPNAAVTIDVSVTHGIGDLRIVAE